MEAEYRAAQGIDAETEVQDEEKPPAGGKPLEKYQYNFTDNESRIMKVPGGAFEQCYNAQAASETAFPWTRRGAC
jgi:hypothetical protein